MYKFIAYWPLQGANESHRIPRELEQLEDKHKFVIIKHVYTPDVTEPMLQVISYGQDINKWHHRKKRQLLEIIKQNVEIQTVLNQQPRTKILVELFAPKSPVKTDTYKTAYKQALGSIVNLLQQKLTDAYPSCKVVFQLKYDKCPYFQYHFSDDYKLLSIRYRIRLSRPVEPALTEENCRTFQRLRESVKNVLQTVTTLPEYQALLNANNELKNTNVYVLNFAKKNK